MTDAAQKPASLAKSIHDHWWLFLIEGILLLIIGTAAILLPAVASIAVTIFIGWLFLVVGIVGLVTTFAGRNAPGFWWALLSAVVTIGAGALLLFWPISGALSLTLILTAFLVIDGAISIFLGLSHRTHGSQRWIWMTVNGVLDLILAAIIVWALPGAALWVLGLIFGIDMIFGGWSLIAMAIAARKVSA